MEVAQALDKCAVTCFSGVFGCIHRSLELSQSTVHEPCRPGELRLKDSPQNRGSKGIPCLIGIEHLGGGVLQDSGRTLRQQ